MVQNQMPPSTITISHGSAWVPTAWCSSKMMMMIMTTTIEDDDDNDNDNDDDNNNNNNDNNNDKDEDNYNYNDTDNDTDNDNNDNNNDDHDDDDNDTDNDNNNNNDDNSSNDNNDDNDDSDRVFFILRPQRMTAARSREKISAFSSVGDFRSENSISDCRTLIPKDSLVHGLHIQWHTDPRCQTFAARWTRSQDSPLQNRQNLVGDASTQQRTKPGYDNGLANEGVSTMSGVAHRVLNPTWRHEAWCTDIDFGLSIVRILGHGTFRTAEPHDGLVFNSTQFI
ncbi:hypothetical protein CGLO_16158 [Aspergillus niger]|uniref:Uncharacterized protein n=1 Tax=Aspergillus niger TaxID=5061 RepID=A0A117E1U3_ASPNG|nr:hypothetical protein CGLO_16158 [Aspergillus niger]